MLEHQNLLPEGSDAYREVLRLAPSHVEARFRLGLIWMKMDRQEAARQELEQVLRKAPDHSGAIHNLAKVYGRLGMEGERQELLARHRELDSLSRDRFERDTRILYHMNSGITHFNENRFQEAIGEFSAGVDLDPRNARGFYYLGKCYLALEKAPDALENLQRAMELEPGNAGTITELGRAYQLDGDLKKASDAFREAIRKNPNLDLPHFYLAQVLESQNQPELSRRHLAEYRRIRDLASTSPK